ncbi:hypothetical protein ACOME3_004283 [Neoechinorhynchus agilis]
MNSNFSNGGNNSSNPEIPVDLSKDVVDNDESVIDELADYRPNDPSGESAVKNTIRSMQQVMPDCPEDSDAAEVLEYTYIHLKAWTVAQAMIRLHRGDDSTEDEIKKCVEAENSIFEHAIDVVSEMFEGTSFNIGSTVESMRQRREEAKVSTAK